MSVEAFVTALARRRATAESIDAQELVPACCAQLEAWGARRLLMPDETLLTTRGLGAALRDNGYEVLTWPVDRGWRELLGLDDAPATCAITVPTLAVAERGTLVIEASTTHGRSLDAVGWWHLAILPQDRIVATLGEALRRTYGDRAAPSAVSLVSGPSRTSDVEKITTYGAHGALAEHVLIVK